MEKERARDAKKSSQAVGKLMSDPIQTKGASQKPKSKKALEKRPRSPVKTVEASIKKRPRFDSAQDYMRALVANSNASCVYSRFPVPSHSHHPRPTKHSKKEDLQFGSRSL